VKLRDRLRILLSSIVQPTYGACEVSDAGTLVHTHPVQYSVQYSSIELGNTSMPLHC